MTITTRKLIAAAATGLLLIVLLILGLALLLPIERADSQAMAAANALVEAGNTVEAIELYEAMMDQGAHDSSLFYNLGNAYMVAGQPAAAIPHYQRAAALDPRDGDIRANLALAIAQAPAAEPVEPSGPLALIAGLTSSWLSLDETAVVVAVLWFVVAILVLLIRVTGQSQTWLGGIAVILTIVMLVLGASLASRAYLATTGPSGIVTGEVATAGLVGK